MTRGHGFGARRLGLGDPRRRRQFGGAGRGNRRGLRLFELGDLRLIDLRLIDLRLGDLRHGLGGGAFRDLRRLGLALLVFGDLRRRRRVDHHEQRFGLQRREGRTDRLAFREQRGHADQRSLGIEQRAIGIGDLGLGDRRRAIDLGHGFDRGLDRGIDDRLGPGLRRLDRLDFGRSRRRIGLFGEAAGQFQRDHRAEGERRQRRSGAGKHFARQARTIRERRIIGVATPICHSPDPTNTSLIGPRRRGSDLSLDAPANRRRRVSPAAVRNVCQDVVRP